MIREEMWTAKEEMQWRMQAAGPTFRLRVEGRRADGELPWVPGDPWIRMTRPGREVLVFITSDRGAAEQAAQRGFEVRGLQDGSQRTGAMSSVRSGRSYDPTFLGARRRDPR